MVDGAASRRLTLVHVSVLRTPADLVGFKLRVPENDVFKAMAEAWGAKPTPMNFGELYLALKQGVVDGQENPLPTIKAGKFDEVQKYLVLTAHIITPRLVVVNEAFWKGLKPGDRVAFDPPTAPLADNGGQQVPLGGLDALHFSRIVDVGLGIEPANLAERHHAQRFPSFGHETQRRIVLLRRLDDRLAHRIEHLDVGQRLDRRTPPIHLAGHLREPGGKIGRAHV